MLTLAQLAASLGGEFQGNPETPLLSISTIVRASRTDLCCYLSNWPIELLQATDAAAVILEPSQMQHCPVSSIIVSDPLAAIEKAGFLLTHNKSQTATIDPSAVIADDVEIGPNVSIGPQAIIQAGARIMANVVIGANVVVNEKVIVGAGTVLNANVIIHADSILGEDVYIDSGSVVGALPFNFKKSKGQWAQGLNIGAVIIGNAVSIGANTVIDRGTCSDTFISDNVCIDNLVQIAHDVQIGPHTAIAGCAAIGAFTQIGADCILGGACCIAASVQLVDNVVITGMSTVSRSINQAGLYTSGTMVSEHSRWRRNAARFRRLDDYINRLYELEKAREKV